MVRKVEERPLARLGVFAGGIARMATPAILARARRRRLLAQARDLPPELAARLAYYVKRTAPFSPGGDAPPLREIRPGSKALDYIDLMRAAHGFGRDLRVACLFGDTVEVPARPALVKSRPIHGDNANSLLLPLDRFRHFHFPRDPVPFEAKRPGAAWRGIVHPRNAPRHALVTRWGDDPRHDIGHVGRARAGLPPAKAWLRHAELLRYRYLPAPEGIDVATALKWIMGSNSIAMSPPLEFETWYMEGRLQPGVHFIELQPDFADLDEKIAWYETHPEAARAMIRAANEWTMQFRDPAREALLETLVVQAYMELSGQLPDPRHPERILPLPRPDS